MTTFITLSEVKAQLNMTSTANDAELQDYLDAACDEVEQWVGPVATRVITGEFVDLMGRTIFNELTTAGTRDFVLRWRPVQSIQSITSAILAGVTYAPTDFFIDTDTGIVRRNDGGTIFGPLVVSYTAGYATPPAWARLAAKIIVQHLWRTQRGGAKRSGSGDDDGTVQGVGFAIPGAAAELLESHRLVPAIG
ncbi:MAG: head-tail connector protein [Mycobacteriaceae bacterium]